MELKKMKLKIGSVYKIVYHDKDKQFPQCHGKVVNATVVDYLDNVVLVVPWCTGHEQIYYVDALLEKVGDDKGS
jgi:hypothetical protein